MQDKDFFKFKGDCAMAEVAQRGCGDVKNPTRRGAEHPAAAAPAWAEGLDQAISGGSFPPQQSEVLRPRSRVAGEGC